MKTVTIEFSGCIFMVVDAATDDQAEEIAMSKLYAPLLHNITNIGTVQVHDAEVVKVE